MNRTIKLIIFFSLLTSYTLGNSAYAADYTVKGYIDAIRQPVSGRNYLDYGGIGWVDVLPDGIPVKDAFKNDGKKIAFLTFDDGPSTTVTPDILDTLKEYNIKATFFVTGSMAKNCKNIVKRIHDEGHTIANHSYSHEYSSIYSNPKNLIGEIKSCENILKDILGNDFSTNIFRFPGGSFGNDKSSFKAALKDAGYKYINWNVSTGDASGYNVPASQLLANVKEQSYGKNRIVVLMHDLDSKRTTAQALPSIIEYLISQGYEFKKLI